ncbi:tetratricopeptide (TPR) repeat protein [Natronospira proteinivora]|uniref:Tetratricopeptide (TPR) repeat protein n=1 Tax=Natronospira proteinivora TaxID=1807133 RepID=A0ABT1GEI3_9GAMM|nr:hypothetical protein [Natronospira proteinivora]MCP1728362.1 tetratricopeptide (TPR) repeat protein [Natronospira proteinivora]
MALLDDEERIPPVWERLPRIFLYPLHSACLVALGLYSLLYLAGMYFPLAGWLLVLLAYVGLYKFAADCLEATAYGQLTPPETQSASTSWMLLKLFGLLFVLYFTLGLVVATTGSVFLTVITGLVFALCLPAAIMIVVMTNSLLNALNPLGWMTVITRIGWGYFIAVLLLALLLLSQGVAETLLVNLAGLGAMTAVGLFFIGGYFLIASYHLMGYLIFENHEALGVDARVPSESPQSPEAGGDSPLLQEVRALVRDGQVDEAVQSLKQSLNQGGLPEEHDQYRRLLKLKEDEAGLLEHARAYIPVLLYGLEQEKKAMNIAAESLKQDPDFRPKEPKQVLDLARVMDRFGDYESIIRITNGFAKQHPHHPDVAENYYLAAKALWFGRGKGQQAAGILKQLRQRYPEHPLADDMKRLVEIIQGGGQLGRMKPSGA